MALSELIQSPSRRISSLALIVTLGIILHRLESLIPLPSPWIKLGLANVMTLITLVFFDFRDALMVTLLRITLGSILGGTFLSPTFFLSLSGSIVAVIVMTSVYSRDKDLFSLVGVSICAAYAHNLSSLAWVYFFFIQQDFFFRLLPIFFTFSLLTGLINGVISNYSVTMLREEQIRFK